MSEFSTEQFQAVDQEMAISIGLIVIGLKEVQSQGRGYSFHHLSLLTLASGIERLLKLTICLGHLGRQKAWPTYKSVRDEGHDLLSLLNRVLADCFHSAYVDRRWGSQPSDVVST